MYTIVIDRDPHLIVWYWTIVLAASTLYCGDLDFCIEELLTIILLNVRCDSLNWKTRALDSIRETCSLRALSPVLVAGKTHLHNY